MKPSREDAEITIRFLYMDCSTCGGSGCVLGKVDKDWKAVNCRACGGFQKVLVPIDDVKRGAA